MQSPANFHTAINECGTGDVIHERETLNTKPSAVVCCNSAGTACDAGKCHSAMSWDDANAYCESDGSTGDRLCTRVELETIAGCCDACPDNHRWVWSADADSNFASLAETQKSADEDSVSLAKTQKKVDHATMQSPANFHTAINECGTGDVIHERETLNTKPSAVVCCNSAGTACDAGKCHSAMSWDDANAYCESDGSTGDRLCTRVELETIAGCCDACPDNHRWVWSADADSNFASLLETPKTLRKASASVETTTLVLR